MEKGREKMQLSILTTANCYTLIENFGTVPFSVRIQQQKTIIYSITIPSKTIKKIRLRQGHALYLTLLQNWLPKPSTV